MSAVLDNIWVIKVGISWGKTQVCQWMKKIGFHFVFKHRCNSSKGNVSLSFSISNSWWNTNMKPPGEHVLEIFVLPLWTVTASEYLWKRHTKNTKDIQRLINSLYVSFEKRKPVTHQWSKYLYPAQAVNSKVITEE